MLLYFQLLLLLHLNLPRARGQLKVDDTTCSSLITRLRSSLDDTRGLADKGSQALREDNKKIEPYARLLLGDNKDDWEMISGKFDNNLLTKCVLIRLPGILQNVASLIDSSQNVISSIDSSDENAGKQGIVSSLSGVFQQGIPANLPSKRELSVE